jgi:hypothetical protein
MKIFLQYLQTAKNRVLAFIVFELHNHEDEGFLYAVKMMIYHIFLNDR